MKVRTLAALALSLMIATSAVAQEKKGATPPEMTAEQKAMMDAWQKAATPGDPHKQLMSQYEGTWTTKQSMWMEPGKDPIVETGKSVNTAVFGGRQLRMDYTSQFMGQPYQGLGFSGYDNITGKYVSTWMDSMSTSLFVSEGEYDPASKTYTYHAQMPDPMKPDTMVPVRNVVRIIDNDHHVFEMYETRDGKEAKTMQIEYTRSK
ncbi:MAG TPA: DUF1579 domain-containing protein [Lysobacter sp.]|nr:DUF1579 domain-containing protein [Lysobacter sp.]